MQNPFAQHKGNGFPLTLEQARALMESTRERVPLHAMLSLALNTGISQPETLQIEAREIDFSQGTITLHSPRRTLRLSGTTLDALSLAVQQKRDGEARLFSYSDRTVDKAINELGIGTLGFPLSWSSLRKTWAVLCFQNGVGVTSMVRYSGSSVEALAKWAVYGRAGKELPIELFE